MSDTLENKSENVNIAPRNLEKLSVGNKKCNPLVTLVTKEDKIGDKIHLEELDKTKFYYLKIKFSETFIHRYNAPQTGEEITYIIKDTSSKRKGEYIVTLIESQKI